MLRIMYINPVGSGASDKYIEEIIQNVKRHDVEATVVHLSKGPVHLEYHYYEHLIKDELLRKIREAEKEGYNAVIIGCFYDPGLRVARELVKIPVVAPAEACSHIAATLGHKFSIIVGRRKWIPKMQDNLYLYGLERKLASFRVINFDVMRMIMEKEKMKEAIYKEARKAIEEDGAEVIVLGCTAESGFAQELSQRLKVPVIDPVITAWKFAEMMADLFSKTGLTHSKIFGYEPPPEEA